MFHSNRPIHKVPFTPFDIIIECCSIGLLVYIWVHFAMVFGELPETVPSHFNSAGQPDSYSGKNFLFFLPILATGLYILMFVLTKYPHQHNYMVNITEENAPQQYRFSVTVLRVVNLLCTIMFAYINYQILLGAKTNETDLGMGFVITIIGASILLPIVILIYQKRMIK